MVNAFNAGRREHIGRKGVASHSLKLTGDFGMLASLENSFIRPQFGLRRWIAHLVHFLSNRDTPDPPGVLYLVLFTRLGSTGGLNVMVQPKEVPGVPDSLERDQSVIVGSVCGQYAVGFILRDEIHVRTAGGILSHGLL